MATNQGLEVYEARDQKGRRRAILRTLYDRAKDEVWVHAKFFNANQMVTLLCASCDGEPLTQCAKNTYVRAAWVRKEKAKDSEVMAVLDRAEATTREAAQRCGSES